MNGLYRLRCAVAKMATLSEAPAARAIEDSETITTGSKGSTPPPGAGQGTDALLDEWDDRFDRLAQALEREVRWITNGREVPARSREGLEERVLNVHVGLDPVTVAFIEACSSEYVQKTRRKHGLRAGDGEPA